MSFTDGLRRLTDEQLVEGYLRLMDIPEENRDSGVICAIPLVESEILERGIV